MGRQYKLELIPTEQRQQFLTRLVELRDYLGMSWEGCGRVLVKEYGVIMSGRTVEKIYSREITSQ